MAEAAPRAGAAPMLDLIDYGGGNTGSIARALKRLGADFRFVGRSGPQEISGKNPIVLPGVGSFGAVMNGIAGLKERLLEVVRAGTPFLGICVGLQILFERSAESPGVPGLGLLEGEVVRFEPGGRFGRGKAVKVPQIGWNRVEWHGHPGRDKSRAGSPCHEPGYVYFVNSYYAVPADPAVVLCTADYYGPFCAAVRKDNITAYQFHPEKSGAFGHELLGRWIDAAQKARTPNPPED